MIVSTNKIEIIKFYVMRKDNKFTNPNFTDDHLEIKTEDLLAFSTIKAQKSFQHFLAQKFDCTIEIINCLIVMCNNKSKEFF